VGASQLLQRVEDPTTGAEPLALMEQAARGAAEDCGAPGILEQLDGIYVPRGLWGYTNPAAILRERLGAPRARTGMAPISGTMVQRMLAHAACAIAAGRQQAVLIVGGEAERSKRRAWRAGVDLAWTDQPESTPDLDFGGESPFTNRVELTKGLTRPAAVFSLFENAMRHARGESLHDHVRRISELWAGFSKVSVDNPHAWSRAPLSADEIATPSPDNALVAWPYTKRMCANMVVDQAAALLICSSRLADRLGIAPERRVYLHASTEAAELPLLSNRKDFATAPELAQAGARALELAGVSAADVEHLDLYSCFPAAVALAQAELGLDPGRRSTVTGGLAFAGGPFNSYVLHSTASMIERLRAEPGARGLVTGVGGFFTKLAFSVLSSAPPPDGYRHEDVPRDECVPRRVYHESYVGPARVETYALHYSDGTPEALTIACLTPDGGRTWAVSDEAGLLEAATQEELCGRSAQVREAGGIEVE